MADYARVMVIMAHPDDLEDFCGGTLAQMSAQGSEITALLLTSGEKGGKDHALRASQLSVLRESEQAAAARVLGISRTLFLREPDGELLPTLALRRRIMAEIRRYQPDIVFAPDPTRYYFGDYYINHQDHRAAGEAILAAVTPGGNNARYFPELLAQDLQPHQVQSVWLTTPSEANHYVDISAFIETKIKAFMCHASQYSDANRVRQRMLREAAFHAQNGKTGYREAFRVMRLT